MLVLSNNTNMQHSIIFIFENNISFDEQKVVIDLIKNQLPLLISKLKFMRILECIVGCFENKLIINTIINFCLLNINKIIKEREGYFLLRTIIKSSKDNYSQNLIVENFKFNFMHIIKSHNGSLLIQCILHNFPIKYYKYYKCCSKHISKSFNETSFSSIENLKIEDKNTDATLCNNNSYTFLLGNNCSAKEYRNIAYEEFIFYIIYLSNNWSNIEFLPIIECMFKVGGIAFEIVLMKSLYKICNNNCIFIKNILNLKNKYQVIESICNVININNAIHFIENIKKVNYDTLIQNNNFIKNSLFNNTTNKLNIHQDLYLDSIHMKLINYKLTLTFNSNNNNKINNTNSISSFSENSIKSNNSSYINNNFLNSNNQSDKSSGNSESKFSKKLNSSNIEVNNKRVFNYNNVYVPETKNNVYNNIAYNLNNRSNADCVSNYNGKFKYILLY